MEELSTPGVQGQEVVEKGDGSVSNRLKARAFWRLYESLPEDVKAEYQKVAAAPPGQKRARRGTGFRHPSARFWESRVVCFGIRGSKKHSQSAVLSAFLLKKALSQCSFAGVNPPRVQF